MARLTFDEMAGAWLRRVARSTLADRVVLRGSLVTRRFFPSRACEDVDHLVIGATARDLPAIAEAIVAVPDDVPLVVASRETLWADTDFPGHRVVLASGDATLQVDLGFGDPITIAPERATACGALVLQVRAESMIAWKLHGLVELGPRGRWRPKDLHDLHLYAGLAVDAGELAKAIEAAFSSRGDATSLLEPLMRDATWGTSKGSRSRWKRHRRTTTAPDLPDVIATIRARFAAVSRSPRPADPEKPA